MFKRKLLVIIIPVLATSVLVGAGFGAWYFDSSYIRLEKSLGVKVEDKVETFGFIETLLPDDTVLKIDQGGFFNRDNLNKKIHISFYTLYGFFCYLSFIYFKYYKLLYITYVFYDIRAYNIPLRSKNKPINNINISSIFTFLFIMNFFGFFSFINIVYFSPTTKFLVNFLGNDCWAWFSYSLPLKLYLKTGIYLLENIPWWL